MAVEAAPAPVPTPAYPIRFEVDPPARQGRLGVFFRYFMTIPQAIVLYFVLIAAIVIHFISWFVILFTGKYPEGMLRFSIGAQRWSTRVSAYSWLLTSKYPPFSLEAVPDYPVRFLAEEQVDGRNRLTTFWLIRWILAIPHFFVLTFLWIAAAFVLLVAWVVAVFTAQVPAGMHSFLEGVLRWTSRLNGYIYNLCDEYPPFSMK